MLCLHAAPSTAAALWHKGDWACREHICTGTGLAANICTGTDWAHPSHICTGTGLAANICTGTGLAPPTSAPGLTGLTPTTSAPGLDWVHPCHICTGTDWAHPHHICTGTGLAVRPAGRSARGASSPKRLDRIRRATAAAAGAADAHEPDSHQATRDGPRQQCAPAPPVRRPQSAPSQSQSQSQARAAARAQPARPREALGRGPSVRRKAALRQPNGRADPTRPHARRGIGGRAALRGTGVARASVQCCGRRAGTTTSTSPSRRSRWTTARGSACCRASGTRRACATRPFAQQPVGFRSVRFVCRSAARRAARRCS